MSYTGKMKLVTLSIGVVWAGVLLPFVVPGAYVSLSDWLPRAYVFVSSWLTPPYLYLIINGIILSIAASSRFSLSKSEAVKTSVPALVQVPDPVQVSTVSVTSVVSVPVPDPTVKIPVLGQHPEPVSKIPDEEEEEFVIRGPRWSMETKEEQMEVPALSVVPTDSQESPLFRIDSMELPSEYKKLTDSMERPPMSSRFSRKSVRPSPEGKALRVSRPRKNETLESTWRTITEGRAVPLGRHLKKSDTWDTRVPRKNDDVSVSPLQGPTMQKAETFHERGATESPAQVSSSERKVKREPSVGQDELNRRVEAFINKFNEEMRLQRQESFKHYMDMINRGADQ
ncbi:hypothetical protein LUZ60_010589 [Juncus effusus]|nr:hypothetical protein LUZ60_010589 [Juncus effusus]